MRASAGATASVDGVQDPLRVALVTSQPPVYIRDLSQPSVYQPPSIIEREGQDSKVWRCGFDSNGVAGCEFIDVNAAGQGAVIDVQDNKKIAGGGMGVSGLLLVVGAYLLWRFTK